jgi:hypothetical protein
MYDPMIVVTYEPEQPIPERQNLTRLPELPHMNLLRLGCSDNQLICQNCHLL